MSRISEIYLEQQEEEQFTNYEEEDDLGDYAIPDDLEELRQIEEEEAYRNQFRMLETYSAYQLVPWDMEG